MLTLFKVPDTEYFCHNYLFDFLPSGYLLMLVRDFRVVKFVILFTGVEFLYFCISFF